MLVYQLVHHVLVLISELLQNPKVKTSALGDCSSEADRTARTPRISLQTLHIKLLGDGMVLTIDVTYRSA